MKIDISFENEEMNTVLSELVNSDIANIDTSKIYNEINAINSIEKHYKGIDVTLDRKNGVHLAVEIKYGLFTKIISLAKRMINKALFIYRIIKEYFADCEEFTKASLEDFEEVEMKMNGCNVPATFINASVEKRKEMIMHAITTALASKEKLSDETINMIIALNDSTINTIAESLGLMPSKEETLLSRIDDQQN